MWQFCVRYFLLCLSPSFTYYMKIPPLTCQSFFSDTRRILARQPRLCFTSFPHPWFLRTSDIKVNVLKSASNYIKVSPRCLRSKVHFITCRRFSFVYVVNMLKQVHADFSQTKSDSAMYNILTLLFLFWFSVKENSGLNLAFVTP